MDLDSPIDSYRTGGAPMWGWFGIAAGGLIVVLSLVVDGFPRAFGSIGVGFAVMLVSYATFMRPSVDVHRSGIVVRNIIRNAYVPFARMADLSTQWGLEILTDDGKKVSAFAAPDPQRRDRKKPPSEHKSAPLVAMVRGGEEAWLESDERPADTAAAAGQPSVQRSWDWTGVAFVLGAAAIVVLGFLLA
ncbi:PH domain-containing protein [Demequina flava]|uniref:PH domain-containing protein n=1 Tax=Demequina flava TaxID=1095025 RepID=UPI000780E45A|nr:PH domain-containing protein [Demequina flava]